MVSKLSIIIPTLNEEKYLPKLLDSITMQNFGGKLQIIVVDGSSQDRTIEVAESYKDKFNDLMVLKTQADIGHQKNLGAESAKCESLLFIDADMILPKNLLNRFTENINSEKKTIHNIFFLPTREGPIHHYLWFFVAHLLPALSAPVKPVTSGGFMFTTKTNHREIGGFKEGAIAAEDIDYGERSIKNGAKFKFHYDCFVYNSTRRAQLMGLLPMNWFYLRGFLYYEMHGVLYDKEKFYYPYGQYSVIGDKKVGRLDIKPRLALSSE